MSKLTRKIIISLLTWVLIFLTLGTTTFAWFSMNYVVEATGLEITVKSNATYLLIGDNAGIATNKMGLSREVAARYDGGGDENRKVYPAFYGDGTVLGTEVEDQVTTTPGRWYTASNGSKDNANDSVKGVKLIATENEHLYMLTYKVWMTLSADSLPYEKPLVINFNKTSGDDSVSIVVMMTTYSTNSSSVEKFHLDVNNTSATTVNNIYVSKNTAYEITILAYIDGTSENVHSEYYTLHGLTGEFNIEFDILP